MRANALNKISAMIEVSKRDIDKDLFWKVDTERAKELIDSQLREVEILEYIYNLIEKDNEK